MKRLLLLSCLCMMSGGLFAKGIERINIWAHTKQMPGTRVIMEAFVPEQPNGTAVIICPGGSYHHLGIYSEGHSTAKWFVQKGVVSFVLRYRVAKDNYHYPAMMQDVQRALQVIRENADTYKIDPDKVGLIGFSAGGHLVTWAGAFATRTDELKKIGIQTGVSLCPNFVIAVYPVVSMQDDIAHQWSRKSLLGKNPTQEQKDAFSLELNIPEDMPPVYLVACRDDPVVHYENSERLHAALQQKHATCTFASYDQGGHGFGMSDKKFIQYSRWNDALATWLHDQGFLSTEAP